MYFPNWSQSISWRAVGQRSDQLGSHLAVTVYHGWHRDRIAYTILGLPALAQPSARTIHLNGIELRPLTLNGRPVVTWRRNGRTCVLSGQGASVRELEQFAAWTAPGLAAMARR